MSLGLGLSPITWARPFSTHLGSSFILPHVTYAKKKGARRHAPVKFRKRSVVPSLPGEMFVVLLSRAEFVGDPSELGRHQIG